MSRKNRDPLLTDEIYHVYNRGVNRQEIFPDHEAFDYFLSLIDHCRKFVTPLSQHARKSRIYKSDSFCLGGGNSKRPTFRLPDVPVELHAYCLMPNHFHLLVRQTSEGGISWFVKRICDSYAKAFNKRFSRTGPLWEGRFKAKQITDDYSYLQLIRYIHLNPYYSEKLAIRNLRDYPYSSFPEALDRERKNEETICDYKFLRGLIASPEKYQEFVEAEVPLRAQKVLETMIIEAPFD